MKKQLRTARIKRTTTETDIGIQFNLDGNGLSRVKTGIAFLDHMLTLFAKHGLFDLEVRAKGDLDVDIHHTNEDIGITLGQVITKALGSKTGIRRYGFASIPMDEALVRVTVDLSGRPYLSVTRSKGVRLTQLDNYSFHDGEEFLRAFTVHAAMTLHIEVLSGHDTHHILEGIFKALARALDLATQIDNRVRGIPSTKGSL